MKSVRFCIGAFLIEAGRWHCGKQRKDNAEYRGSHDRTSLTATVRGAGGRGTAGRATPRAAASDTDIEIDGAPHVADLRAGTAPSSSFPALDGSIFVEKVRDIVGLYLNPPENAVGLWVDEKSQIQALERTQPRLPLGLG